MQQAGESLRLNVWSPPTVNSLDSQRRLASLHADLLVVCDYGEILRPETLATARLGGINLHGSLLPKYRGAAPVQWAILCGEIETGNSAIHMTPGLDAGPLLGQQRTPIDPDEDAEQLEKRLAGMGAKLVLDIVDQLENETAKAIEQDKSLASKAPRLKKEQGLIDWNRSATEIKNQVRALRPWPRAFTFWQRPSESLLRLNIDLVRVLDKPSVPSAAAGEGAAAPGSILECSDRLVIAAGVEAVEIIELQPAGKRSMSAAEFVRGYHPNVGEHFTGV